MRLLLDRASIIGWQILISIKIMDVKFRDSRTEGQFLQAFADYAI